SEMGGRVPPELFCPLSLVHEHVVGGTGHAPHHAPDLLLLLARDLVHCRTQCPGRLAHHWSAVPAGGDGVTMALGRRKAPGTEVVAAAPGPPTTSLVASAARIKNLEGRAWRSYRFGDDTWQVEAWRLYDIIGELRFVANWIGSACSRVRIYVAEVDDNGRVQKEVE